MCLYLIGYVSYSTADICRMLVDIRNSRYCFWNPAEKTTIIHLWGQTFWLCGGYKNILYAYAQIFVLSLVHYELGLCLMEDSWWLRAGQLQIMPDHVPAMHKASIASNRSVLSTCTHHPLIWANKMPQQCNSIVVFTTNWKFWCCCIHCLFSVNECQ